MDSEEIKLTTENILSQVEKEIDDDDFEYVDKEIINLNNEIRQFELNLKVKKLMRDMAINRKKQAKLRHEEMLRTRNEWQRSADFNDKDKVAICGATEAINALECKGFDAVWAHLYLYELLKSYILQYLENPTSWNSRSYILNNLPIGLTDEYQLTLAWINSNE